MSKISLKGICLKDVRKLLNERGQFDRFLSEVDRLAIIDALETYDYGDARDEGGYELYNALICTSFAYDTLTDEELMIDLNDLIDNHGVGFDKTIMKAYVSYIVEKEILK